MPGIQKSAGPSHKRPIYSAEAAGLLIISILIFIVLLVRYWHSIAWSAH